VDEPSTVAEVLAEMDRLGIQRALVAHTSGWESVPWLGNRRVEEEAAGHARLTRAWTALPDTAGDVPPAQEWLTDMLGAGARAAWLFPKRMNWSMEEWCAGSLLRALEDRRVPAFILLEETELDQLHRVLERHSRLPLVLSCVSYRLNRMIYPLLERHANLHLDLAPRYDVHEGIEDITARVGAKRLLFGTNFPICDAGSAIAYLAYARISEEERALVGAGNLERLLAEVDA